MTPFAFCSGVICNTAFVAPRILKAPIYKHKQLRQRSDSGGRSRCLLEELTLEKEVLSDSFIKKGRGHHRCLVNIVPDAVVSGNNVVVAAGVNATFQP